MGETLGRYMPWRGPLTGSRPRILFVTVMSSAGLRMLDAIPRWRDQFDLVIGYVIDAFDPFPLRIARRLDHLFIIIPELVELLAKRLQVPVSYLPLSCNVLAYGSEQARRGIDILAYGRQQKCYIDPIDRRYVGATDRLYLGTFSLSRSRDWRDQRRLFWQVLRNTRISLAFPPESNHPRFQGLPVISARWYEGMAAGCAVVGREPPTPAFRRTFDWPDALTELPDDPAECVSALEGMLHDRGHLEAIHRSNYVNMLRKHDVRVRFMEICHTLHVIPPRIADEEYARVMQRLSEYAGAGELPARDAMQQTS